VIGSGARSRSVAALLLGALIAGAAWAADAGRTPKPVVTIERSGQCVAPVDEMRRNHMVMLRHDRDKTVRQGIRKVQASLQECVNCHASSRTGSVDAAPDEFCASCHSYAGVKLDCFECHTGKANAAGASAAGGTR
jgi:hypothetical protein